LPRINLTYLILRSYKYEPINVNRIKQGIDRQFFDEPWNHGNLEVSDEMLGPSLDIKSEKEWARSMYATFGNMHFTILDIVAEGD
jgi:hypothetical protein